MKELCLFGPEAHTMSLPTLASFSGFVIKQRLIKNYKMHITNMAVVGCSCITYEQINIHNIHEAHYQQINAFNCSKQHRLF